MTNDVFVLMTIDVFCVDDQQRKKLKKQHGLRMSEADYAFYQNQTSELVGKCVDAVVPFPSADKMFLGATLNQKDPHVLPLKLQQHQDWLLVRLQFSAYRAVTVFYYFRVRSGCRAN